MSFGAIFGALGALGALSGSRTASRAARDQKEALRAQTALAERQQDLTEEQYQRYLDLYAPVEEQYLAEVQRPVPYEALAGRAEGTVGREFDAQREALSRDMARYGVSPASQRSMALVQDASLTEAVARAQASNQARLAAEEQRRAGLENIMNYGKGMPMQAQNGLSAAGTAMSGVASAYGNKASAASQTVAGIAGGMGKLYGYGKEAGWWGVPTDKMRTNAAQNVADIMGPISSGNSFALPEATSPYFGVGTANWADGGEVPSPVTSALSRADTVPGYLSEGEFVIPAHVVKRKGTEFFERLIGQGDKQKAGAL